MTTPNKPLMPKATAVWLVENTALTFEQISDFCDLHMLEVQGIADGDVAQGIRGKDPITGGELTREEIRNGEADPNYRLKIKTSKVELPKTKTKKAPRYTPVSRRQDRPNAILWLVKNHPEMKDPQIIKLLGTTKPTIKQIRERTHWNINNLQPQDPVALGLCSQIDLDSEVRKAAARSERERIAAGDAFTPAGGTLASAAATTGYVPPGLGEQPVIEEPPKQQSQQQEDAEMLARLKKLSSESKPEDDNEDAARSVDDVFNEPEAANSDAPVEDKESTSG